MLCDDRVKNAESLVQEFEALTESKRRQFYGHPKVASFLEEYFTAKALTDFWTHLSCVVYHKAMHHYYAPLHGPSPDGLATFLQDWTIDKGGYREPVGEKFIIIAREHCKTQQCIAWLTWLIARDTNERIMIRSHKDEMAEAILQATVGVLEMADYRKRYPWVSPKGGWKANGKNGSKEKLMLERELEGVRTASLMRFGFGSQNIGEHFSTALYDDWETEDTATSDELRPLLDHKYSLDNNVMMGGAKRLTTGTPYWINAYLHLAMQRKGRFADRSYGLFVQPCYVPVFKEPFVSKDGQVELINDDRKTFRCMGAGFPTIEANLTFHQARVLFFSHAAKDFVTEIREVVWNDGEHFRVNRPFPRLLGDPIRYEISAERPACPNRMTMDSVDVDPNNEALELDHAAPFIEVKEHVRESLVDKERTQGKTIFGCQMELNPMNEEDIVFDWNDVKEFSRASLPEGERVWARTCDIAGPKKTTAHTAIMDGFRHETGYYITHLFWGDPEPLEILLELCMGVLRLEKIDKGQKFRWTSLEKAAREEYLRTFLPQATRDPQAYFAAVTSLARYAKEFEDVYNLEIPIKELSRPAASKGSRIHGMEPAWTKGEIYVAREIEHLSEFQDECIQYRPNITAGFDILDCLNDFVQGSRNFLVKRKDKKPAQAMGRFAQANRFSAQNAGPGMVGWPG